MKKVNLYRIVTSDQGTNGFLEVNGFKCAVLELPWRGNKRNCSCIPDGVYHCVLRNSPKFGLTYHITNVPNRSYILIHSGNVAGDETLGYRTHTNGCILLGKYTGILHNQKAVLVSRRTLRLFREYIDTNEFELEIFNYCGGFKCLNG